MAVVAIGIGTGIYLLWMFFVEEQIDKRAVCHNPTRISMSQLTEAEKQNGKRKVLIPSQEIQDLMHPITEEEFAALVRKTIPPQRDISQQGTK